MIEPNVGSSNWLNKIPELSFPERIKFEWQEMRELPNIPPFKPTIDFFTKNPTLEDLTLITKEWHQKMDEILQKIPENSDEFIIFVFNMFDDYLNLIQFYAEIPNIAIFKVKNERNQLLLDHFSTIVSNILGYLTKLKIQADFFSKSTDMSYFKILGDLNNSIYAGMNEMIQNIKNLCEIASYESLFKQLMEKLPKPLAQPTPIRQISQNTMIENIKTLYCSLRSFYEYGKTLNVEQEATYWGYSNYGRTFNENEYLEFATKLAEVESMLPLFEELYQRFVQIDPEIIVIYTEQPSINNKRINEIFQNTIRIFDQIKRNRFINLIGKDINGFTSNALKLLKWFVAPIEESEGVKILTNDADPKKNLKGPNIFNIKPTDQPKTDPADFKNLFSKPKQ